MEFNLGLRLGIEATKQLVAQICQDSEKGVPEDLQREAESNLLGCLMFRVSSIALLIAEWNKDEQLRQQAEEDDVDWNEVFLELAHRVPDFRG